jgi:hypothetical protein
MYCLHAKMFSLSATSARKAVLAAGGLIVCVGMVSLSGQRPAERNDVHGPPVLWDALREFPMIVGLALVKFARLPLAVRRSEPPQTSWLPHSVVLKLRRDEYCVEQLARVTATQQRSSSSTTNNEGTGDLQQLPRTQRFSAACGAASVVDAGVSTAVLFAYLVMSAWAERESLSRLERTLAFIAISSLLGAVPLSRHAWRYQRDNADIILTPAECGIIDAQWLRGVDDILGVTAGEALCDVVGPAVLPRQVVEELAGFVDTTTQRAELSLAECRRVQRTVPR